MARRQLQLLDCLARRHGLLARDGLLRNVFDDQWRRPLVNARQGLVGHGLRDGHAALPDDDCFARQHASRKHSLARQ